MKTHSLISGPGGVLLALAMAVAVPSQEAELAWARVSPNTGLPTITPNEAFQFSTQTGLMTVTRIVPGRFEVVVPNFGVLFTGVPHATALAGNATAVVRSFAPTGSDLKIFVDLYDATGALTEGPFSVSFRAGGDPDSREGYLWANDATSPSYTPAPAYSWNGGRADPTITRLQTGRYRVRYPDLAGGSFGEYGSVVATIYGATPGRVNIEGWTNTGADLDVTVRTFSFTGAAADRQFTLSYNQFAAPIHEGLGSGAHVWANEATTPRYVPNPGWTDSNGPDGPTDSETIERMSTGRYRVHLPNLTHRQSANAHVTAYGGNRYATVYGWLPDTCGGTRVQVDTFDAAGNRADARFVLRYLTSQPAAANAWVNVDPTVTIQNSWTTHPDQQFNGAGDNIQITRDPANRNAFWVNLPNVGSERGCVLATAVDGNHLAVVRADIPDGNGGRNVLIEMWTTAGARAENASFALMFRRRGALEDREGYVVALTNGVYSSYEPRTAWNGDRPAPSVARLGAGEYQVTFPGLASTSGELGHVQATAYGAGLQRATVRSWTHAGGDLQIRVDCRNGSGALADANFSLLYNEQAAPISRRRGSGAHVWASNPTASGYLPQPAYTDSNGDLGPANAEAIQRVGTGVYRVLLPNVPAVGGALQLTPYGTTDHYASIADWSPSGSGTVAEVHVFDGSGVPFDGRFNLLYLTDHAVDEPATNDLTGVGCNGPTLNGITRPVLCQDWHLELGNLPSAATLAFLQLDLTNPGIVLGPNAPGCTLYTGGAATLFFGIPVPLPVYTLAIPASRDFLGLSIFAQGGALVPGINAYSVALTNGLRGKLGDS